MVVLAKEIYLRWDQSNPMEGYAFVILISCSGVKLFFGGE